MIRYYFWLWIDRWAYRRNYGRKPVGADWRSFRYVRDISRELLQYSAIAIPTDADIEKDKKNRDRFARRGGE